MAPGLRIFEIYVGYVEIVEIEKIFQSFGINAKAIFYGLEHIITKNLAWRVFAFINRVTPTFAQFYKLFPHKLHGVVTGVEM